MTTWRCIKNESGEYIWLDITHEGVHTQQKDLRGKDPTIDQYISEKGGIKSHLDNKVYITKASYLDSIKSQGHHINE